MKRMAAVLLIGLMATAIFPALSGSSEQTGCPAWRSEYHTFSSMVSELTTLQANHPEFVHLESIGKTYENRDIWAVKLSDDVATNDSDEPDVLVLGPVHAREIMGVEVPMNVLNYLINNYGINETCTRYINTREVWFVPMPNPDGHVYFEQGNDWRKNRRPLGGGAIGVDLNRNWGYQFGTDAATSNNPLDETYHGPYPFSENETIALRDLALRQRFVTSVAFHSYSMLVLYPWGYTTAQCPDNAEFVAMANVMVAYNGYQAGAASELYVAHGGSDDWLYGNVSTRAFTFELDTSFNPPASQIDYTCGINREPTLYLIGYPQSNTADAGLFEISAPVNGTILDPDRMLNISLKVMNAGTAETDIPVELELGGPSGYRFTNSTTVRLRAGQTGELRMAWLPPIPGDENYTLTARTNLSGDKYLKNNQKTVSFRMMAKYGASLAAASTAAGAFPSDSATYELTVTSLSNREDNISLILAGTNTDWAALGASVHLPPAGRQNVSLVVSVPKTASPGETAMVSVRAQSSTGQGLSGLVTTVTTVQNPAPGARAGPDRTVNVSETVRFDGSLSTTPAGHIVKYEWDFGDGNSTEGANASHAYARRGKYTATLTVTNDLNWTNSDTINVTVLQEFRLGLAAGNSSVTVDPGKTVNVTLTLRNLGNGRDDVRLELEAPRWNASLPPAIPPLAAGGEMVFSLRITAPQGQAAFSDARFRVVASSREYAYSTAEVTVSATVNETHSLSFSIANTSKIADAGASAVFSADFLNHGNIAENITMSSNEVPEGWTVQFAPEKIVLGPGNVSKSKITVSLPASALAGEYSLKVNGIRLNVSVNPRYAMAASVINTTTLHRGASGSLALKVRNIGNIADSYTVAVTVEPISGVTIDALPLLTVASGADASWTIRVQIDRHAKGGTYPLKAEIRSTNTTNASLTVSFIIEVPPLPIPQPGPGPNWSAIILILVLSVASIAGAGAFVMMRRRGPPPEAVPAGPNMADRGRQGMQM